MHRYSPTVDQLSSAAGVWHSKSDDYRKLADEIGRHLPSAGTASGTEAWYKASYGFLVQNWRSGKIPSDAELSRLVAYAYSWVATIPKFSPVGKSGTIAKAIAKLRKYESLASAYDPTVALTHRERLLHAVRTAIARSDSDKVVIASKILHFWNAKLAPMIDVNVAKAWGKLDVQTRAHVRLRTISSSPTTSQYLRYWEIAFQLRKYTGISYRDLDKKLFRLGKSP